MTVNDSRLKNLRAALAFLRFSPTEPELQLLHRWLDTWTGVGLITVGVERHGMRLSLSHITEGEWRARFRMMWTRDNWNEAEARRDSMSASATPGRAATFGAGISGAMNMADFQSAACVPRATGRSRPMRQPLT